MFVFGYVKHKCMLNYSQLVNKYFMVLPRIIRMLGTYRHWVIHLTTFKILVA